MTPGLVLRDPRLWLGAIAIGAGVISLAVAHAMATGPDLGLDFLAIWAAADLAWSDATRVYDAAHLTELQERSRDLFGRLRPFAYPPTALVMLAPFGLLPFWPAFAAWTALNVTAVVWAVRRVAAAWWTLAAPSVVLCLACGQTSIAVGVLVLAAFLDRDSALRSGVLLGLALALKPQLALFAPAIFLLERRWANLFAAAATGGLLSAVATLAWGPEIWLAWMNGARAFAAFVLADSSLLEDMVTPYATALALGLPGAVGATAGLAGAALMIALSRRAGVTPAGAAGAALAAGLLASPYAMPYDLAALAPAALAGLGARLRLEYRLVFVWAFAWALDWLGPLAGGAASLSERADPQTTQKTPS